MTEILILYIVLSMTIGIQPQKITQPGGDTCSDRKWKEEIHQQLNDMQSLLQRYAMKFVDIDKRIEDLSIIFIFSTYFIQFLRSIM